MQIRVDCQWWQVLSQLANSRSSRQKGEVNSFTLDEIFDIVNESLIEQRLILIRRTASFTIVPADERIDLGPLPRSTIDELENLPRTLTEVCLPIRAIPPSDAVTEVKKMLGPFGQVSALDNAKQLVLSDFAGNLRYIIKVLKVAQGSQNLPIYIYVCRKQSHHARRSPPCKKLICGAAEGKVERSYGRCQACGG